MHASQNTFMTRTTVTNSAKLLFATRELRRHTTITESEVIAIRRRWSPVRAARNDIDVAAELCDLRVALPMRIAPAQAQKGLLWWHQQLYTKHGEPRNTKFTQSCENMEPGTMRNIRNVVRNFSHFTLEDFVFEYTSAGMGYPHPVYCMHSKDGESFRYVGRPWQQGGIYLAEW